MITRRPASPWAFFVLLLLLSVPFWWLGAYGGRLPFANFLPVSALMTVVPMIAALVLVYREGGATGSAAFLRQALDFGWIKGLGWILAALLLMPAVFVLQYGVLRLSGAALPDPQFFPIAGILAFFLMFFVGAIGEELGWQAYAFGRLRGRWSALATALFLGVVWAAWHVIPFAQMGRSGDWIVWHCLSTVAMRVIIVWLFVNTGQAVLVAVLFHTMSNMPYGILSNYGSYYDPLVAFLILATVVGMIAILWEPASLSRLRWGRHSDAGTDGHAK
jgi:membrane protease YdiL (CAAX protease family)